MSDPRNRLPSETPRAENEEHYVYRRALDMRELVPAIGAGVVTGLTAFYVVRLLLERTPLVSEDRGRSGRRRPGLGAG